MATSEVLTPLPILNVTLAVADNPYTIDLAGIHHFSIQSRTAADFRFAWAAGLADGASPVGPYMTCKSGQVLNSPEKIATPSGTTLHVSSDNAGQVIEVLRWQRQASV